MFFVIDFETSSLNPWDGFPLTLGIVPINKYGDIMEESNHLYIEFPIVHEPDWHMPANLTETEQWWLSLKNSEEESENIAFESAWWRDTSDKTWGDCMQEIVEYFKYIEPDKNQRFLCANPVAFDKAWMDYQFSDYDAEIPYHYRSLCLRSMRYGLEYGQNQIFGSVRDDHTPLIPHHALHDARAEAYDLKQLMDWARADWDFKVNYEPEPADDL